MFHIWKEGGLRTYLCGAVSLLIRRVSDIKNPPPERTRQGVFTFGRKKKIAHSAPAFNAKMIYPFDQSLIWHVIFHPGPALWSKKYRHVSLAGFSNDTWLHIDVNRQGFSVAAIYHHDEVKDFLTYLLAHYTVLRFGPSIADKAHFFKPMTCVSFVKHTLGVRSCALRPDGLFSDLVRNYDVKVLNEAENPQGNA